MLESHPELKHVALAVKYPKTDERHVLLTFTNGPYGVLARPYSVPPNTPQTACNFTESLYRPRPKIRNFWARRSTAKLEFTPVDTSTMAKMVNDLMS
jgi:hypothetical protein